MAKKIRTKADKANFFERIAQLREEQKAKTAQLQGHRLPIEGGIKKAVPILALALLASCAAPGNSMTSMVGGRTLSFSRRYYALDSLTAVVERRRTKSLYLYDSLVRDSHTAEIVYYRQITEDKETVIQNESIIRKK